eukprot:CAMPEP_0204840702 /NCGR_PEP_ID=MMETSP1346-20131115/38601_1 /ASSEMBLY_ACC=CAM_ASM_000771 /TAXON_ID=215587 /ORGANISM="Aplanochytrium stocchinoi, Strain GSBS06" /LENGTH=451 /DNA_ID=CAMNT_0051978269 /DNA_START=237 /DNA_END=1589 /DNA_ORIENTATION=+
MFVLLLFLLFVPVPVANAKFSLLQPLVGNRELNVEQRSYGIQIDAGSSGTRLHVYTWPAEHHYRTIYPASQLGWNVENRPGISHYGRNYSMVEEKLGELLSFAKRLFKHEGLSESQLKKVPIFLGATAGMRVLHPADADSIMMNAGRVLKSSGFHFEEDWARILSGEEEGVFGWITVNYLLKRLAGHSRETVGTIDLGGASTQVTLHPPESILANFFPLRLSAMAHDLYTHSYLYYGNDQARNYYEKSIVIKAEVGKLLDGQSNVKDKKLENPCWPVGYSRKVEGRKVKGTGNWKACMKATDKVIRSGKVPCKHSDGTRCGILGVYQPKIFGVSKVYAMSYFYYVYLFFELEHTGSLEQLSQKAEPICSLSYSKFVQYVDGRHPKVNSHDLMMNFCFGAAYVISLLHEGLHFPIQNTSIIVVEQIEENDISWAFGSMLWHANLLNEEGSGW